MSVIPISPIELEIKKSYISHLVEKINRYLLDSDESSIYKIPCLYSSIGEDENENEKNMHLLVAFYEKYGWEAGYERGFTEDSAGYTTGVVFSIILKTKEEDRTQ